MEFNQWLYLSEMEKLVRAAKAKLVSEHPDFTVYTVSIWTDPNSAVSAINFDTIENSRAVSEKLSLWAQTRRDQALAIGDSESAELFKSFDMPRNYNSADFILREFLTTRHQSFEHNWETNSDEKCWAELEPALYKVGTFAKMLLKDLKLHPEAELGVNSHLDWFDASWKLDG